MANCNELEVYYWDVFPKSVKVSLSGSAMVIPLSIRGNPIGSVQVESGDESIAFVDEEGRLHVGMKEGATVVLFYDSEDKESVRFVQVEAFDYSDSGSTG